VGRKEVFRKFFALTAFREEVKFFFPPPQHNTQKARRKGVDWM
jgi:hypothetical protein